MATFTVNNEKFTVGLGSWERRLLGRPNIVLDLFMISDISSVVLPETEVLGVKTSKRALLGNIAGEYRSGSKKLLVLGSLKQGRRSALRIQVLHPSIDEI